MSDCGWQRYWGRCAPCSAAGGESVCLFEAGDQGGRGARQRAFARPRTQGRVSSQIVEAALRRGLLVNAPRPTAIRFMPALNVTREEIDQMIGILRETNRSVI